MPYDGCTNVKSEPFDFRRWRRHLEICADSLRSKGYDARFSFTDEGSKPSTGVQAKNELIGGYFSNWITGEADFEVMDLQTGKRVVNKVGLILSDSTFEATLNEFVESLTPPR